MNFVQVEEFVETEGLTSNTAATMMYWNVVGSFVSLALLFLDVFIPVDNQTGTLMGMSETIWGMGQWVLAFIWFGFAVTAAVMAGAWSSPVYLVWYLLFTAFLFFFGYTVYSAASAGESVGVDKETMKSPLLDRQQSDASNVQRDVFVWTAFALVAPHVANTMFMLLQRRDWILNGAVFMSVFAACICPIAIEYMQDFFSGIVIAGSDDFQKAFIQHKRKNRMMKIMLIVILSVVLLLTCSTLPVFPASSFSNMFYTVLIVSACLSLCFVSLFRHIVHVSHFLSGRAGCMCLMFFCPETFPVSRSSICRAMFQRFHPSGTCIHWIQLRWRQWRGSSSPLQRYAMCGV